MYQLRPYQQEAVDATIKHFRKTNDAAVIVLPTGAGKSLVIAELARLARQKILVVTHVKELVAQNFEKFSQYADQNGVKAGIFSAGLSLKQTEQQVTFASIQSVARNLDKFAQHFSLIIIDECHRVSGFEKNKEGKAQGQYGQLAQHLKEHNSALKILGLTATPYRLGMGWVYKYHHHGFSRNTDNPPFVDCIYELPLAYMINNGYLTPPNLIDAPKQQYDFSALDSDNFGNFNQTEVNDLLAKYPRVTEAIIEQVVEYAQSRKGVMIFAATVKHAKEIVGYLPLNQTALITGDTDSQQRSQFIDDFKAKKLKYLVNVSVLTTGFDAPHVDLIAILRPTESVSLYQQIVGRGLRLAEGKKDCLVIDYAGNDINLFYPEVGDKKPNPNSELVQVFCPSCGFANAFWGKKDEEGNVIEHYGRKCQGLFEDEESGERLECDYRFVFKECSQCNAQNDIAARQCHSCGHDLVDPDDKLKDALNLKDHIVIRCAGVEFSADDKVLTISYFDEDGLELKEKINFSYSKQKEKFNSEFGRRFSKSTKPTRFTSPRSVVDQALGFTKPDFVIAKKQKHYFQVQEKVFDYQGRFRKANSL